MSKELIVEICRRAMTAMTGMHHIIENQYFYWSRSTKNGIGFSDLFCVFKTEQGIFAPWQILVCGNAFASNAKRDSPHNQSPFEIPRLDIMGFMTDWVINSMWSCDSRLGTLSHSAGEPLFIIDQLGAFKEAL